MPAESRNSCPGRRRRNATAAIRASSSRQSRARVNASGSIAQSGFTLRTNGVVHSATPSLKAGVKPEALLEAIKGASFGQNMSLSHHIPDIVFKGDFDTVRFGLALARKDVGLATALAREFNVPMPIASLGEQILMEAMARGWGDKDSTSPWMLQEEAARVQVRATK